MTALRLLFISATLAVADPIKVPAFTGYGDPSPGLKLDKKEGSVLRWGKGGQSLLWFGNFKTTGELTAALQVRLENGHANNIALTLWPVDAPTKQQKQAITVTAARLEFPAFKIETPGYYSLRLDNATDELLGDVLELQLDGAASQGAHFRKVERRNAASVHLNYANNLPKDSTQQWFYNEVTAQSDPVHTFYMACGFRRGYFGMQVNSETERRIIFSVWDSGDEAVDRKKVAEDNRVKLLAKGEGVEAHDFGNEGTGGHSHLVHDWKTGLPQKFLLHAQPKEDKTIYTAFFWMPEKNDWSLIACFQAPKDGQWLRGHHSFVENFVGQNGHLQRHANFGPGWACDSAGKWTELLKAGFTHDGHGKAERLDYFATPTADGRAFTLSNGGFLAAPATTYGQIIERKTAEASLPKNLPKLPY
jgi:hypothetical protein